MGLQEDIRQEKFTSEYQRLMLNILVTSSWVYSKNSARLKGYGITPEQYNVLRILRGSHPEPLRLADVASRMIDKNSNATRLVEKLRLKGYVKRELCKNNRRQVDISITESGLKLVGAIDKEEPRWISEFKTISKSEAAEMSRLLEKLRTN